MATATSVPVEDYDCTDKCRSTVHGNFICDVACRGSDVEVLSMWKKSCLRFYKVKDEFGRAAIHAAASTGRNRVVEWLVKKEAVDVNTRDGTSGYTPLHRSILFGHLNVARTLIRLNASIQSADYEGYYPLDLFLVNRPKMGDNVHSVPNEVYVWGSNENYNLGIGTQQPKLVPELMDRAKRLPFEYVGSCVIQICMERYHTLFIHLSGDVFACGYGAGGRLGLGNEFSAFTPTKVDLGHDQCVKAAVGSDHSLFLTQNGEVKSCGANENLVLGHKNTLSKILKPKKVDVNAKIIDIAASRIHSVFLSKDAVYVCGVNVGQMRKAQDVTRIAKPEKVELFETYNRADQEDEFKLVACTEFATVVTHSGGLIYVMRSYDCLILNARNVGISKIQLLDNKPTASTNERGAVVENDQSRGKLMLYALNTTGRLLIWRDGAEKSSSKPGKSNVSTLFNFIVFPIGRSLTLRDFAASSNAVVFINSLGEAFKASVPDNPVISPSLNANFVSKSKAASPPKATSTKSNTKSVDTWNYVVQQSTRKATGKDPFSNMLMESLRPKRIPNIYSGVSTFSDPRGKNFAITQIHQKANLVVLPTLMPSELYSNFEALLNEACLEDNVHDAVFDVKGIRFPVHRFIIGYTCPPLLEMIKRAETSDSEDLPVVVLKDIDPHVFTLLLQFLYTNSCDIFATGGQKQKFENADIEKLKTFTKKLNLPDLQKKLKLVSINNGQVNYEGRRQKTGRKFKAYTFKELYDVELVSEDGKVVGAHLCVLVARLEYYKNMMFSSIWMEGSKKLSRLNFPGTEMVMELFLNLVYEDTLKFNRTGSKKDLEVLSQALIATDLLLAQQFKSQIEDAMVDSLNVDNVSDVIQLADVCNAPQLKETCMEFICLNIAPLLENRSLDLVPNDLMNLVSDYYRRSFSAVSFPRLRSDNCPSQSEYEKAEEKFGSVFEELEDIEEAGFEAIKKSKTYKIKSKTSLSSQENASPVKLEEPARNSESTMETRLKSELRQTSESPPPIRNPNALTPKRPVLKPTQIPTLPISISKPILVPLLPSSEFPSFDDVAHVSDMMRSPPSTGKVLSTSSPSQQAQKKKTKWVTLNKPIQTEQNIIQNTQASPPKAENPWNKTIATSPNGLGLSSSVETKLAFDTILLQEQKKKDNLAKALEKSIQCSQIEEAAMNELRLRYYTADVEAGFENLEIALTSVENEYAIPMWKKASTNPIDG